MLAPNLGANIGSFLSMSLKRLLVRLELNSEFCQMAMALCADIDNRKQIAFPYMGPVVYIYLATCPSCKLTIALYGQETYSSFFQIFFR